jgi:hypothetical protein
MQGVKCKHRRLVSVAYEFITCVSGPNRYYSRVTPEILALPSASGASVSAVTADAPEQSSLPPGLENTYLNIDHYTEISSVKNSSASFQSAWPSDVSMDSRPLCSPPVVPEWRNVNSVLLDCSSDKAIFQDSVNSSVVTSASSSQPVEQYTIIKKEESKSPIKMLDPKFIAELEKHLGQKEASANTNIPNSFVRSSPTNVCSVGMPEKVGNPVVASTSSVGKSQQNESPGTSVIPALKPPPQSMKVSQKISPLTSSGK